MYNVATYLPRFVASLAKQPNLGEMEFIFVNDASTDDSAEMLARELEKVPELKAQTWILTHTENQGISVTRQDGLETAQGKYIIWADPDDTMEPGMYQALADKADQAQADVTWCDFWVEEGEEKELVSHEYPDAEAFFCGMLDADLMGGSTWYKLFRRDFLIQHKIRFPEGQVPVCEDLAFSVRVMGVNPKICHLAQPFYHYYKNPNSSMRRFNPQRIQGLLTAFQCYTEAAQTERERAAVYRAKQRFKRELVFSEDCRDLYRVSYDFVTSVFHEIHNLKGAGCNRLQCLFFGPSLRSRTFWTLGWVVYRALKHLLKPFGVGA